MKKISTSLFFLFILLALFSHSIIEAKAFGAMDCLNSEIIDEDLSGYKEYQGEMYYMYCPISGVDLSTFKSTAYKTNEFEYAHDSRHVYFGWSILTDLNPATFKTKKLSGNFLALYDSKTVYVNGMHVPDADIGTLEFLDSDYFKDKNKVYKKDLESVDGASREHYKMTALPDADPAFFVFGYKITTDAVYWYGQKIPEADPTSFELMKCDYASGTAKDKNNVYWEGKIVYGIDSKTFTGLASNCFDKNAVYDNNGKTVGFTRTIKNLKKGYESYGQSSLKIDDSLKATIQTYESKHPGYEPQPALPPKDSPEAAALTRMKILIFKEKTKEIFLSKYGILSAIIILGGGIFGILKFRKRSGAK